MNPHQLKHLRNTLKLNQAQMATELGVSLITYGRYERGQWPLAKPVEKLLEVMAQQISQSAS